MPYHVLIKLIGEYGEFKLDLDRSELMKEIVKPYAAGTPITIRGRVIHCEDITRILIKYTEEDSKTLLSKSVAYRDAFPPLSDDERVFQKGKDVTDDFIKGPSALRGGKSAAPEGIISQNVFVVHGRNTQLRDSMFNFLRAIELHPIEWIEAVSGTGNASPYIGEVLDVAFGKAQAIIVLLTPDDEAKLKDEFIKPDDPPYEKNITPQARPNVIFEAGMAMGRRPDRTVLVQVGELRPFSDITGRHTVRLDNSPGKRQELAKKLETAGCRMNLTGSDWFTVGDFSLEISQSAGRHTDWTINVGDHIVSPIDIAEGSYLESNNKHYKFVVQADGNLVIYAHCPNQE